MNSGVDGIMRGRAIGLIGLAEAVRRWEMWGCRLAYDVRRGSNGLQRRMNEEANWLRRYLCSSVAEAVMKLQY